MATRKCQRCGGDGWDSGKVICRCPAGIVMLKRAEDAVDGPDPKLDQRGYDGLLAGHLAWGGRGHRRSKAEAKKAARIAADIAAAEAEEAARKATEATAGASDADEASDENSATQPGEGV